MSRREQVLLAVVIALFSGMLFYLFIYTPQQRDYEALALERDQRQSRVEQMRAIVVRKDQVLAEHRRLSARIAAFEAMLPTEKGIPEFLTGLESLTLEVVTDLRAVRPGALEPIRGTAASAQGGAQPAGAQQSSATQAEGPVRYYAFPIELQLRGGFNRLVTLLSRLDRFPRFVNVRRLNLAAQPAVAGQLQSSFFIEAYVLPEKGAK